MVLDDESVLSRYGAEEESKRFYSDNDLYQSARSTSTHSTQVQPTLPPQPTPAGMQSLSQQKSKRRLSGSAGEQESASRRKQPRVSPTEQIPQRKEPPPQDPDTLYPLHCVSDPDPHEEPTAGMSTPDLPTAPLLSASIRTAQRCLSPPTTSAPNHTVFEPTNLDPPDKLLEALRYFRQDPYAAFKSTSQKDLLRSVLDGQYTVAIMPTGGGKSVAFEVPPAVQGQITVAAFPYRVILSQAIQNAKNRGLSAEVWLSSTPRDIGKVRLVLMPYESILADPFLQ